MRVTFRQGIVSHESPDPFELVGDNVNIIASNRPVTVTTAHRGTDYIHSENSSVANAWTGVTGADYWLYWDFNLLTFARTFDKTDIEPISQAAEPSSPANGQMWYDTANHIHYERSAGAWVEVLRVFAAKFISGALLGIAATGSSNWAGTQISDTSSVLAGRVLFDEASDTIIRDDGTLFTTEDQFFSSQSRVDAIRLESNVSRALSLDSLIAEFTVVAWKADGKVSAAEYNDVGSTVVGMLTEQIQHAGAGSPVLTASEQGAIITQGSVTNPAWDWSSSIGLPLWVDNGLLTATDPHLSDPITYSVGQVPVARVLSIDTIIFEQGLGGKGDRGVAGPTGPAVAATTTTLGSVALSVAPSIDEAPVAVETNDSRLSNARTPLTHVHAEYVEIVGDTMTGLLILSANPTANLGAATKQYVDTEISGIVHPDPVVALNDLTDVIVAGSPLVADQVLTFDGANWVNAEIGDADLINDLSPQLGGDLDVLAQSIITSVTDGDITITPDGTGALVLDGLSWPTADGTADYVLKTDGAGNLSWVVQSTTLSDDASPTLSATLDLNGYALTSASITGLTIDSSVGASTGFDISSIFDPAPISIKTYSFNPNVNPTGNGYLTPDGTTFFWVDGTGTGTEVYTATLGTPFDISTTGVGSVVTVTGGSNNGGNGIWFNSTGTVMLLGRVDTVSEFTLGTPWDVSTFTYVDEQILDGNGSAWASYVYFSRDGLHAYQGGVSPGYVVVEYVLGTAFDISTISYVQSLDISTELTPANTYISISTDGTQLFVFGYDEPPAGTQMQEYALATPFDVSTASTVQSGMMPEIFDHGNFMFWPIDGTSLYYGDANDIVYQYTTGAAGAAITSTSLYYNDVAKLTTTADGVSVTGDLTVSGVITESATTYGTTGAVSLDLSAGTFFYPTGTTTGAITFAFDNPAATGVTAFTLEMLGAGDNAPVWPAGVTWPAATEPTWTAGGLDIVSFITHDGGTTWLGMLGGLAFA